jgi:WD40 repeat protein
MKFISSFLIALAINAGALSQNPVFVLNPYGHSSRIQKILASPDGQTIYTFGFDKSICLWDARSGKLIRKKWLDIGTGDRGRIIDADLGPKSGVVIVARINSLGKPVVNLVDMKSDQVLGTFEGFSHALGYARIDPWERYIITGPSGVNLYNEPTRIWKVPERAAAPFNISKAAAQTDGAAMHDIAFYNNGDDVVITALIRKDLSFSIHHDPSAIPEYSLRKHPVPFKRPGHMSYSIASGKLLSATHDGEIMISDGISANSLRPPRKHWSTYKGDSAVSNTSLNRSGSIAAIDGSIGETGADFLELYDVVRKKRLAVLPGLHQSVSFLSDTSFAAESTLGLRIYNIVTGKSRNLQSTPGISSNDIGYGSGSRIQFDSVHIFDFENLELTTGTNQQSFSTAKMSYNDQRIELINENLFGLYLNKHFRSFLPHGSAVKGVSYINDGRVILGRIGYRSSTSYLLSYDMRKQVAPLTHEAETLFDGTFGAVTSIAPHPDLESNLFATRDRLGTVSLYDPDGPSTPIFQNTLRQWPFIRLNFDVTGKDQYAYAAPQKGYTGNLRKGDRLESINGYRPPSKEDIIRFLEALPPDAPVDLEVLRGTQRIHSTETLDAMQLRSPLVSFILLGDNEWLCWTPQGYYAASADGERSGGWVINKGENAFAEFHPIYDFKKQFYKPDIIKLIAKHSSFERAVRNYNETSAQPLSLSAGVGEKLPPSINWVSPVKDTTVSKPTFRFVASIHSTSQLQSAKVLLNGRTILRRDQITIRQERESPLHTISFDLDLVSKDNIVNIFAENENGTTISLERVLRLESTETGIERYKPNLYLLSVGVSKHTNPSYELAFADKDALAIEGMYKSQQTTLFRNVFTKTLVNEQATRAGILEAFYWLEHNATQKDVVVIFMASHGLNDKERFYILPYDGDPERIRITGVDWSNFADVLGNLPSKVLVFVDACHSGKLGTNILAKRGDTDLMEAIRALATEENGVVIMAASTGKESSFESPEWQHGAFTLALLEGLGEGRADINGDNIVNIREIDYYVADRVKALTNGRQHPTTQKPSVVSEFPLVMKKM